MTGDENSLASSHTTQKWNAKVSNRRVHRITKWPFQGTYTKLWKATISFIMSVCLSVDMHGTTPLPKDGFSWKCLNIFQNSIKKIQVSLKLKKNNSYFTWSHIYIYDNILRNSSVIEIMFQTKVYRKSKHKKFPWKSCCLSWNLEKYGKARQAADDTLLCSKDAICMLETQGKNTDTLVNI